MFSRGHICQSANVCRSVGKTPGLQIPGQPGREEDGPLARVIDREESKARLDLNPRRPGHPRPEPGGTGLQMKHRRPRMALALGLLGEPLHIPCGRFEVPVGEGHVGMADPNHRRPTRGPK